ncbi:MAG: hypothetical protein HC778_06515 [Chamaesiphon sp. CSU_1_12]|nr:hypothetical protein [Chamaesiphon sp. CSU_1_12]
MNIKDFGTKLAIGGSIAAATLFPAMIYPASATTALKGETTTQEVLPSNNKIAGWQDFVPAWKFYQGAKTFVDFANGTMQEQYRTYHWLTPDEIAQAKCYADWKEGRRAICNQYPVPSGWKSAPSDNHWACDMYK